MCLVSFLSHSKTLYSILSSSFFLVSYFLFVFMYSLFLVPSILRLNRNIFVLSIFHPLGSSWFSKLYLLCFHFYFVIFRLSGKSVLLSSVISNSPLLYSITFVSITDSLVLSKVTWPRFYLPTSKTLSEESVSHSNQIPKKSALSLPTAPYNCRLSALLKYFICLTSQKPSPVLSWKIPVSSISHKNLGLLRRST